MATPAQVLANRENAQKSTGPRTEEGKAHSSLNAVRHNLTARGLIVPLGKEAEFTQFEAELTDQLTPRGGLQLLLFRRILECAWALERCRWAEAELFAGLEDQSLDPLLLDEGKQLKFARIQKYARQNESSMLKLMRELGKLQTEFQYRDELVQLTEEAANDPEKFALTPQSRSVVCSVRQLMAASQLTDLRAFQIEANKEKDMRAQVARFTSPATAELKVAA